MRNHTGGFDPLLKVPPFKYTKNEERKMFIGHMYPYADYLINIIQQIKTDSYTYEGECLYQMNEEVIDPDIRVEFINGKSTDQYRLSPEIKTFHLNTRSYEKSPGKLSTVPLLPIKFFVGGLV